VNATHGVNQAAFLHRQIGEDTPVIEPATDPRRWPHVTVRHGRHTAVLRLPGQRDHLCIVLHPFTDGEPARAGVFGLVAAARGAFAEQDTAGPSHGRPAARLVCVLIGEQAARRGTGIR